MAFVAGLIWGVWQSGAVAFDVYRAFMTGRITPDLTGGAHPSAVDPAQFAEIDDAPMFAVIRGLLDAFDAMAREHPDDRRRLAFLIMASIVARTPDVPVPTAWPGSYL